jgi:hypothetical protein
LARAVAGGLVALAASLLALLCFPSPSTAATSAVRGPEAFVHIASRDFDAGADVATERGPPAHDYSYNPSGAVDRRSHGASSRPDGASAGTITRYTTNVHLVQVARATSSTKRQAQVADGDLSVLASGRVAADTVGTTTARLQGHVDQAVADYGSGAISMSARQARAAARNPNLEATYRGQVIDSAVKNSVRNDPELSHLWVSRSGEYGPDLHDIGTGTWWDVTTPGQ